MCTSVESLFLTGLLLILSFIYCKLLASSESHFIIGFLRPIRDYRPIIIIFYFFSKWKQYVLRECKFYDALTVKGVSFWMYHALLPLPFFLMQHSCVGKLMELWGPLRSFHDKQYVMGICCSDWSIIERLNYRIHFDSLLYTTISFKWF